MSAALERVKTTEERDAYAREFTGVQTLWELLAPRDELDEHEPLYKWLAQVYEASKPGKASEDILWERLGPRRWRSCTGTCPTSRSRARDLKRSSLIPTASSGSESWPSRGDSTSTPSETC
jgi:hypothetical protein